MAGEHGTDLQAVKTYYYSAYLDRQSVYRQQYVLSVADAKHA